MTRHPLQHQMDPSQRPAGGLRERVHEVIYEADTPAGKAFDIALILCILLSVAAIMLESMRPVAARYGPQLVLFERLITGLFTIEYVLRLWSVRHPLRYATSFYGIVDLLAILPTYLAMIVPGAQNLAVVRVLRMMRMFRVLKLGHMVDAAGLLRRSLYASRHKILVFLLGVGTLITVIASLISPDSRLLSSSTRSACRVGDRNSSCTRRATVSLSGSSRLSRFSTAATSSLFSPET